MRPTRLTRNLGSLVGDGRCGGDRRGDDARVAGDEGRVGDGRRGDDDGAHPRAGDLGCDCPGAGENFRVRHNLERNRLRGDGRGGVDLILIDGSGNHVQCVECVRSFGSGLGDGGCRLWISIDGLDHNGGRGSRDELRDRDGGDWPVGFGHRGEKVHGVSRHVDCVRRKWLALVGLGDGDEDIDITLVVLVLAGVEEPEGG